MKNVLCAGLFALAALAQGAFAQSGYIVTVDTSSLNSQAGNIDLQFNPGMLTSENACVTISNFTTDGSLGTPASTTGSVTGTLATSLTINNGASGCSTPAATYTSTSLNDYNQPITFGNTLSFFVTFSGPGVTNPNSTTYNSGSTFGLAFTQAGNPALTSDPSNFAGAINLNLDGTQTANSLSSSVTIQSAELVTITTGPSGLSFSVDGTSYSASTTLPLVIGSNHALATTSPQAGATGTEYIFNQWSDATTSTTDNITVATGTTTYTAQFNTYYLLTTAVSPSSTDGSVGVSSTATPVSGYYPSGSQVTLTATTNTGYNFSNWTGTTNSSTNPLTLTMSSPVSETANFGVNNVNVTINTSPQGLPVSVDSGTAQAAPAHATWQVGSNHTIAVASPQGSNGTRYTFTQWSDGTTNASDSVTASSSVTSYTASFSTAYLLTAVPDPTVGGTVTVNTPSPTGDGYYPAGTPVNLTEASTGTYSFSKWTGTVASTANPLQITMTKPMLAIANFVQGTVQVNVGTNPNGLTYTIDGQQYTSNTTLTWTLGTKHSATVSSPQQTPGASYAFKSWSDGGTQTQTIVAVQTVTNYIATFTPTYQLSFNPTYLSFPAQGVNTMSAAETLTLMNSAPMPVTIGTLSISDSEYALAAGGNGCTAAIPANGGTCTLKFTFTPNQTGLRTGLLTVPVVGGPASQPVSLRGTGAGALTNPISRFFGSQNGNTLSPTQTITFTNYLASSLSYTPSITGANAGDFLVQGSSTCPNSGGAPTAGSLAGNASCTYVLAFQPTANGAETAVLSLNDADGTQTTNLSGTGIGAAFSSISIAFPTTTKGHTSATKTITLYNYLSTSLSITGVSFSGPNAGDFSIQGGTCPTSSGSLAGNSSCTYILAFTPSTTTTETGKLTVTDADGSQSINLVGAGH